jgi:hypothetical protein
VARKSRVGDDGVGQLIEEKLPRCGHLMDGVLVEFASAVNAAASAVDSRQRMVTARGQFRRSLDSDSWIK